MNNEHYLIHKEDYLNHIHKQIHLYTMIKQMSFHIKHLPSNRGSKELSKMAECFDSIAESMFKSMGIPKSYIFFGDESALTELMENELITPEDAGYYACDSKCCCGCYGGCCEDNYTAEDYEYEYDEEDAREFAKMMHEITEAVHNYLGDHATVSIHID